MAHQQFEQRKLFGAELNGVTVAPYHVGDAIQFQVVDLQYGSRGAIAATQHGANARGELFDRYRLAT
jgi:hypothetical protein